LPMSAPVEPVGEAVVQIWRTIPMHYKRKASPFARGEFTVLAGVAKAVAQARHLITIWDQYFWSKPLAKLIASRVNETPGLKVLIVLPPYGTAKPGKEMLLRKAALQELWTNLKRQNQSRVLVRNMWDHASAVGIYVHDKVQTYDDALFVCGSANMNRRSFECDAELDCAVLHTPTVRGHLAGLYASLSGEAWNDFGPGWLDRYWTAFKFGISGSSWFEKWLIEDPFFREADAIGDPELPNKKKILSSIGTSLPDYFFEPTCFATDLATPPADEGLVNPDLYGRLDGITYLIERYHDGDTWRLRVPYSG
jgi:hypothetical protein